MSLIRSSSFSLPRQLIGLLVCLAVSYLASAIGAWATFTAREFYALLEQPSWAPPGWLFGPVWTFLYTLMGVSLWLIWRSDEGRRSSAAFVLFMLQLAANALWSWLFFAWKLGAFAFFEIVGLWILILATIVVFWKIEKWAALLLVPYLLWVSFATLLAYTVWQMNPSILG